MATFQTRNGRTTATIRRKGYDTMVDTFDNITLARAWATKIERQIDDGKVCDYPTLKGLVIRDLLKRYSKEVLDRRKGWRQDGVRVETLLTESWVDLDLTHDIAAVLRLRKAKRLKTVSGQTFNRELNLISGFFDHCIKEWGVPLPVNPATMILRAKESAAKRKRVWADDELHGMLEAFKFDFDTAPSSITSFVPWVLLLLRYTGLRIGTLCSIRLEDIHLDERYIQFGGDQVKNGDAWQCPLSRKAIKVVSALARYRRGEAKLLPSGSASIGGLYRDTRDALAVKHPSLKQLHIHGLRHSWTTEFAGKIADQKLLLKISGRKSMSTLIETYYQPDVSELARLMD